jgi:Ca2+/H+ antiporter, TMEM165/GDT1 family
MVLAPLITSFVVIFLAELGDKTLLAVLLLSTRHRAWPVIAGAFAAFFAQGLIAVALGSLVALLPPEIVRFGAAAIFVAFGVALLVRKVEETGDPAADKITDWKLVATSFTFVFMAEWGDATQIGSAMLVARYHSPVQVFAGATLGLWTGTLLAVMVGRTVGKKLPRAWLQRSAGVIFCVLGIYGAIR